MSGLGEGPTPEDMDLLILQIDSYLRRVEELRRLTATPKGVDP